jgi:large subunit ribosomal protein L22
MKYSYNLDRNEIVFASTSDLNASFKDLCAVCDAVRYRAVPTAMATLDNVINNNQPIEYRRHNKYMGSRHELGGKKGRYPMKCAAMVRKVLVNAAANARNKGEDPDSMYVVHACANKTYEVARSPPKGIRSVRTGGYGYTPMRRSNLAFAKVEIGISAKEAGALGARMKRALKKTSKADKAGAAPKQNVPRQKRPEAKPQQGAAAQKPREYAAAGTAHPKKQEEKKA